MTAASNPQPEPMPAWRDPFAEPNTIPAGWDVSTLSAGETPPPTPQEDLQLRQTAAFYQLFLSLH